ncbi:LysE/ArgO family amino acid transporter [Kaistia hirudinis]|nr:LysE family transporter [Kaistia hirudinis]
MLAAATEGFLLGASLIVAIGAQNAFVLRQGLARRQVFVVTTFCFLADALLISFGVAGVGSLVRSSPGLLWVVTLAGAAFLLTYGAMALRRALHPGNLSAASAAQSRLGTALATAAALTFLNPHVYLDTVVLLGSLSARHAGAARVAFGAGAAMASAVWFYGLGFGARFAAPLFARPAAWRILDGAIAIIMASIALSLLAQVF